MIWLAVRRSSGSGLASPICHYQDHGIYAFDQNVPQLARSLPPGQFVELRAQFRELFLQPDNQPLLDQYGIDGLNLVAGVS